MNNARGPQPRFWRAVRSRSSAQSGCDGHVADVDRREFQMRRRKVFVAFVERRLQSRDQAYKSWNRIIGTLRVRNMALAAGDDQGAVERTAASDLDRVANDLEIARFAENAMIEALAAVTRPLEKLDRAVDRNALLIAGDEERDRAFRFAAVRFQIVKRGGDKAGNAALHVDGAAAIQALLGNLPGKWRMRPRAFVTRRDDVGVPRE